MRPDRPDGETEGAHPRGMRHTVRYLMAAGLNTVVGLSIYPLLILVFGFHDHYLLALVIAQALGLTFAFTSYKVAVFRSRAPAIGEFGTFISFYLITYVIAWISVPLLVERVGLHPVVAQMMFSVCAIVGSYFWHNRFTFRTSAPKGR